MASPKCPKSHCSTCQRNMQDARQLQEHLNSRRHAQRANLTCTKCYEHFSRPSALLMHQIIPCYSDSQYLCCDCNKVFNDHDAYITHLLEDDHATQPPQGKEEKIFECEICRKKFGTKGARTKHKNSGVHKPLCAPLNCLFSGKCKKIFPTPSAILMHVESGQCISGWSREEINEKVTGMDINRRISISPSLQETASNEEDTDNGEDGWEMIRNEPSWQRSWSFSSFDSISAPSLISDACQSVSGVSLSLPKSPTDSEVQSGHQTTTQNTPSGPFSCPLCPETTFKSALDLAQHDTSLVHSLPLFRLPASLSLSPSTPERQFTSLSGLAQYIESRAQGQDDSFRKALLDLVNEIISEFGCQELRLSLRESR